VALSTILPSSHFAHPFLLCTGTDYTACTLFHLPPLPFPLLDRGALNDLLRFGPPFFTPISQPRPVTTPTILAPHALFGFLHLQRSYYGFFRCDHCALLSPASPLCFFFFFFAPHPHFLFLTPPPSLTSVTPFQSYADSIPPCFFFASYLPLPETNP